jgi:Cu-Zn family superoxide dismutase
MNDYYDFCAVLYRRSDAVAFINGSEKYMNIRGMVQFYDLRTAVLVRAEITGLPTATNACQKPIFAFHIHGGTECTGSEADPFANTYGHYNPKECPHPYHSGDMPPLFGVKGTAFSVFLTDRFSVPEVLGKTVIIHARPDDFTTQPSGNSGERIACGVIIHTAR